MTFELQDEYGVMLVRNNDFDTVQKIQYSIYRLDTSKPCPVIVEVQDV